MKKIGANNINKPIVFILAIILIASFIMPNITYAASGDDSGPIFAPVCKFITFLCDNVMQFMQNSFTSPEDIKQDDGTYDFKYSPGIIFSGTVPALDINFINPEDSKTDGNYIKQYIEENIDYFSLRALTIESDEYEEIMKAIREKQYEGVISGGDETIYDLNGKIYDIYYYIEDDMLITEYVEENGVKVGDDILVSSYRYGKLETPISSISINGSTINYTSITKTLQPTIATWYNALRKIALVGLLSVLVYIGIQIILTSALGKENSKYKKMLVDWLIALCLLFTLHYIMNFTIVVTQKISDIFNNGETDQILNILRNKIDEAKTWEEIIAEVLMYVIMTMFTVIFTFQYLKRVLYIGFFTFIAPLVTLTYPLDKIKDSKAQAFTMWIREYVFNALIQVVHLVIYYTLVGSALSLVEKFPLYGILAIGFITQGEKIIRKMFGFNNSTTVGTIGAMATGGLLTAALHKLQKVSTPNKKADDNVGNKIRTASSNASAVDAKNPDRRTRCKIISKKIL